MNIKKVGFFAAVLGLGLAVSPTTAKAVLPTRPPLKCIYTLQINDPGDTAFDIQSLPVICGSFYIGETVPVSGIPGATAVVISVSVQPIE
jgi:hypothetical protein